MNTFVIGVGDVTVYRVMNSAGDVVSPTFLTAAEADAWMRAHCPA